MQPLSASQKKMLEEATAHYQDALDLEPEAFGYLEDRGLSDQIVRTSRLGVVSDPLPIHDKYRGWLAIPYLSGDGYPVQIRFRCIQNHKCKEYGHGKYATVSGDSGRMYGVDSVIRAGDTISICEGELDRLTLEQCGLPAVALPGATTWRPHHRILLAGFSEVLVWGDPDPAGAELVHKVLKALPQARPIQLTDDDVNGSFRRYGKQYITDLVKEKR